MLQPIAVVAAVPRFVDEEQEAKAVGVLGVIMQLVAAAVAFVVAAVAAVQLYPTQKPTVQRLQPRSDRSLRIETLESSQLRLLVVVVAAVEQMKLVVLSG